jgi:hypothetical protein
MKHVRSLAFALVGVASGALAVGCSGSDPEPKAERPVVSQATERASDGLRDVLAQVDWPDDQAGVTAVLGRPRGSEDELYDFKGTLVSAEPSSGAFQDSNRAGLVLFNSAVAALGPNNCVDAQSSPVFADYFALGDGVPPGRDRPLWEASMDEVRRVASSQGLEGLLWLQCTQVFDDYTGPGMLGEGQRRYHVAWSDGAWVYSFFEESAAARGETLRALVDAARK